MSEKKDIEKSILEFIKVSSPETVEDLIEQTHKELGLSKDIVLKHIHELQNKGKLALTSPPEMIPATIVGYIFSIYAVWFWIINILSVVTIISVYTIQENMFPYIYIRHILGLILIVFLPGYSLVKILFPIKEINNIERTILSLGTSLILVPLVGLILSYTPLGIKFVPITLSLITLTTILTVVAVIREYLGIQHSASLID